MAFPILRQMIMQRKSKLVAVLSIFILVILASFVLYEYKSPHGFFARRNADIQKTIASEDASFISLTGSEIKLEEYVGKPLIINIWASWSPFSKSDFLILAKLKEQYGDSIQVVAINRMETKETARAYIDFIDAPKNIEYIIDNNDHYFKSIHGYAMPETIVYDTVGDEHFHKRGSLLETETVEAVASLISKEN